MTTIRKLGGKAIRQALNAGRARMVNDGHGLYLQVTAKGSASWLLRYKRAGRTRYLGLGPLAVVDADEARAAALDAHRLLRRGLDPLVQRDADRAQAALEQATTLRRRPRRQAAVSRGARDRQVGRAGGAIMTETETETKPETKTKTKPKTKPKTKTEAKTKTKTETEIKGANVLKLVPATSALPKLIVHVPDLPATARAAARMLARRPHMFEYDEAPVRLVRGEHGIRIQPLTLDHIAHEIHAIAQPVKFTNKGEREVTISERVCRLVLALKPKELAFRPLAGITSAPLIRADGTIKTQDGYDPATGFFCDQLSDLKLTVPERPSKADAEAALMKLREPIKYFPFEDAIKVADQVLKGEKAVDLTQGPGQDETAALTGIVTAVARPSLDFAPGIAYRAPRGQGSGAGKGLLARASPPPAASRPPRPAMAMRPRPASESRRR